jgi:hypothetical protein
MPSTHERPYSAAIALGQRALLHNQTSEITPINPPLKFAKSFPLSFCLGQVGLKVTMAGLIDLTEMRDRRFDGLFTQFARASHITGCPEMLNRMAVPTTQY